MLHVEQVEFLFNSHMVWFLYRVSINVFSIFRPMTEHRQTLVDKHLYRQAVSRITRQQEKLLPTFHRKSKLGLHTDHIVPVSYGFEHNICPYLIGSMYNLCFIPKGLNLRKSSGLTKEALLILDMWEMSPSAPVSISKHSVGYRTGIKC